MPRCFVVLSCVHADSLPRGHAAVLRSSRLLPGPFPPGATQGLRDLAHVQFLYRIGPFDCVWGRCFARERCHGVMFTCCHAAIWKREEGQQGDNRTTKKRTTGGQGLETGWQPWPSWCQQGTRGGRRGDKKKTRGEKERIKRTRYGDQPAAAHQKKDKKRTTGGQENNKRTDNARTQRLWPASSFLRENPNSKLFGKKHRRCQSDLYKACEVFSTGEATHCQRRPGRCRCRWCIPWPVQVENRKAIDFWGFNSIN